MDWQPELMKDRIFWLRIIFQIEFQTVLPDTMNVKPIIHDLNEQKTATITY